VRIGLWDQYGGSMPSGWIRYIFEQTHPVKFDVVFPPRWMQETSSKSTTSSCSRTARSRLRQARQPAEARGGMPAAAAGGRGGQAGPSNIPAEYQAGRAA